MIQTWVHHLYVVCLLGILLALLLFSPARASDLNGFASVSWSGSVVGVVDGDTIDVLHNRHAERIRLSGIDCPEKGQSFGKVARLATSTFVFGRIVTIKPRDRDKYKRTVADVFLLDGRNLNHQLVKDGWCWWYRKYAPTDMELEDYEKTARELRRGLWIEAQPIPPWEWRKHKK